MSPIRYFVAAAYVTVLCGAAGASESTQVKEAYNAGLRNAIAVIKHEASQAFKEIPRGYCIEIRTVDNKRTNDFSAVKIETLGLVYLGMKPSLLEYVNPDGAKEKMLCLAIKSSRAYAESALDDIRTSYPKIDAYYPSIVHISNPDAYKRIVPSVGELHEDKKAFISKLIHDNEAQRRKLNHEIETKDKEIARLKKKIADVARLIGGNGVTVKDKQVEKPSRKNQAEKKSKNEEAAKVKPWDISKKDKYPIISTRDTSIRYENKISGIRVEYADKKNPRILKIEKVDIGENGINPKKYQ